MEADRLCTGLAIAEVDLGHLDSVRTRMPISEVLKSISWDYDIFYYVLTKMFCLLLNLLRIPCASASKI
jgi:hypothetical protein